MMYWQGIFVQILAYLSFAGAKVLTSSNELLNQYDFIVVGGGTAGNVVANRLSKDPSASVLVIEAGGSNDALDLQIPFSWPSLISSSYDWNFTSTPQTALGGRSIGLSRGRVLGGSSSINGMLYTRGSSDNYDSIARLVGDEHWSWDSLQPYIRKDEPREDTVVFATPRFLQPIDTRVIQTTQESSEFPFNRDPNSGNQLGFGWSKSTVDSTGRRASSATAYLNPKVIRRPNLHILLNTQVTRLLPSHGTDRTKFKEVEFVESVDRVPRTALKSVAAKREIILSAGTFSTPHILLNSGIGDAEELANIGVTPIHHLPSVGRNLTDHSLLGISWFANSTDTLETVRRNASLQVTLLTQWKRKGTGFFSSAGVDHVGCLRLADTASIFDTVPDPSAGPNTGHFEVLVTNGNLFGPPTPDNFITATLLVLTPLSRGFVKLNSSHPLVNPAINPSYLSHEFDRFAMREAIRSAQRFFESTAWDGYVLNRAGDFASVDIDNDNELDEFIRTNVGSGLHPVGSASMSPKGASWGVTDPDLKVKGLDGLRIVDASVIPLIPAAHTQAPVYIFAERAADIIKKDWNNV